MKIKILVLIAIFSQSCVITGPIVVNTYTDQSYTNLSNFTYTLVKDENSNAEIWNNIENPSFLVNYKISNSFKI